MAERNKVLDKDYDVEARKSVITFIASKNVLEAFLDKLSPEIVTRAALHGLNQKLGDAASGLQGEEAEEAVMGVWEQISAGEWNAKREAGEARPSLVAEAVFEFKTKMGKIGDETLEQVVARYSGKEGAALRAAAMKRPEVAAIMEQKKIERAQAKLAKLQAATGSTGDVEAL